jgi:hypothetical protein
MEPHAEYANQHSRLQWLTIFHVAQDSLVLVHLSNPTLEQANTKNN